MKVLLDDNGFITNFALIGDLVDGIDVQNPENISHFCDNFLAYRVHNGTVVFDDLQNEVLVSEYAIAEYRVRREKECFPVINRGQLWYDTLTEEQRLELSKWYRDWLDGTPTQTVPEKPIWLK